MLLDGPLPAHVDRRMDVTRVVDLYRDSGPVRAVGVDELLQRPDTHIANAVSVLLDHVREQRPGELIMDADAAALQLTPEERIHLFSLADQPCPQQQLEALAPGAARLVSAGAGLIPIVASLVSMVAIWLASPGRVRAVAGRVRRDAAAARCSRARA